MKTSRLYLIVLAVCGLTAGFVVRRMQHPPAEPMPDLSGISEDPAAPAAPGRAQPHVASALAAELEQQLAISPGVNRWLLWMSALEKAKLADLPQLARMAKGDSVLLRIIGARWMELGPQHLFDTIIAADSARPRDTAFPGDRLADYLFEEWTRSDASAALAALNSSPADTGFLQNMRHQVVNGIIQKDPEMGLKCLADWHIDNYGPSMDGITAWAEKDPRHAAEFALAHPAGYATQTALGAIGKVWAARDPEAALTFAAGIKDKFGTALANGIAKEWAAKDLTKAAAWLSAADPSVRRMLSGPVLEEWAKTDTTGAMQWIEGHLAGGTMDEAVGAVLAGVAARDVSAAAALVSGMDASRARARAAVSVAKKWMPSHGSNQPVSAEAVTWLGTLDPDSLKHVLGEVQWQWSGNDPKGYADFLTTPAGAAAPSYALATAARSIARGDPQAALKWAAEVQSARRLEALEGVLQEWNNSQPAAALDWAKQLPARDPRRESYYTAVLEQFATHETASTAAKALASGNPEAARKALNGQQLPPEARAKLDAWLTKVQ